MSGAQHMPIVVVSPNLIINNANTFLCHGPDAPSIMIPTYYGNYCQTTSMSLCSATSNRLLWWSPDAGFTVTSNNTIPSPGAWLYQTATTTGLFSNEGVLFAPPQKRTPILPGKIRAGRRAVRRSIDIYSKFRGIDEIRRFIKGETIVFEGTLFDYHIRKTRQVLEQTMNPEGAHIPYSLNLARKGSKQLLSSGCVIVPSLPVIDQLLALFFHVQDPADEIKLLETTNWSPRLPSNWRSNYTELALAA